MAQTSDDANDYWNDPAHHAADEFWMAHPLIRARINQSVSGDPSVWPIAWLKATLPQPLPFRRALSIGSGMGSLERDLVQQNVVQHVTGVDITTTPLEEARRRAHEEGLHGRIDYVQRDARELLREERDLDAVFFHASLHHFDRLDELMMLVRRALKPDGFLYLDEYVGPSMSHWNALRLLPANVAFYLLPRKVRRTRVVRTPRNPDDPTEAIAAAEIVPAVEKHFRVVERRDYGGNLVSLVYPNLHHDAAVARELTVAVKRLLWLERFVRRFTRSYHTVIVATPR